MLAGCKELILHDTAKPSVYDLTGQFFLTEEDLKSEKSRAELCKDKLQQLNFYVKVSVLPKDTVLSNFLLEASDIKVVVVADILNTIKPELYKIN